MEHIDELKEKERIEKAGDQLTENELDKVAGGYEPIPLDPDLVVIPPPTPVPIPDLLFAPAPRP